MLMLLSTTMTAGAAVGETFTNDDGTLKYTVTSENPYEVSVAATESCTSSQVEIPASVTNNTITYAVTSIGKLAFWQCSNLSSINIGANVTTIGFGAFNSCSSLSTFTVPASVTSIGENAFYGCTGLESFTVSDGNEYYKSIDGVLFDSGVTSLLYYPAGNSATSYDIPNTVTSIARYAFFGSSHLTAITIPSSVRNVGSSYEGAFEGCSSLADVYCYAKPNTRWTTWYNRDKDFIDGKATRFHVFDDWVWSKVYSDANVTYVGDLSSRAIWTGTGGYCGNVATNVYYEITGEGTDKTLTIRKNPYIASNSDFRMADYSSFETRWSGERYNIKTVVIEDGVTTIGDNAFFDFTNLTSVTIPDGVESIRLNAFNGCSSLTSVTIPASVTFIDDDAFRGCSSVASYTLLDGNTAYTSDGRALFNLDGTMLIVYPAANNATSYTIPSSVTTVYDYAFYGSSHLTSVTIPNSVTTIGQFAFEQCSGLTSVTIPNNVTVIKLHTFYGCSGLTSVTIPNSVTIIDNSAFAECSSLTSVTIPNSVTTIETEAFSYCSSLTSVTIPASVKSLDLSVFLQCRNLANVYCYADPFETWEKINLAFSYHTTIHVFDAEAWSTKWSDEKITYKGDLAATPVNYIDAADNTDAIDAHAGQTLAVALSGRTLYKDGAWNTLCLPFDVSTISGPLSDDNVQAMILNNNEGSGTGFDASTGVLTLNFNDAPATIPAGTPFIIRWGTPDDNPGTALTDPVFQGVTIDNSDAAITRKTQTSTDGTVSFKGTYASITYTEENKSILFVGGNNNLYWPTVGFSIGAQRAYFELNDGQQARNIVLNFFDEQSGKAERDNDNATGIHSTTNCTNLAGAWYTLDGRKLAGKPSAPGIYVKDGHKVAIKREK